ncbi:hypothetical protein MXM31_03315 [Klebsiella aerogenes]|uniref:hypothetical protein n=1 Tax=Klebsiella aerogenes TaxID=548 RepID=UPI002D7E79AC|nr:hypothetical protein [Klebsiella aerogenes]MEB5695216.1 hypothetical protein [Klebsiella aerogenes]
MNALIEYMVKDKWDGEYCVEDKIISPSMLDINDAINTLDSKTHTIVFIYGKNNMCFSVGGGNGCYVVYASKNDEQLFNMISKDVNNFQTMMLNVGGQEGDFPSRQVIDKATALQAAHYFFTNNDIDRFLCWEEQ